MRASDGADASIDAATEPNHYAVWGFATNDVWIGDSTGDMIHWDGTQFHTFTTGTTESIRSIWGPAPNDVWAAGEFDMVHWDGARLAAVPVPSQLLFVVAVHGSAPNDVWAVGQAGVTVHWDGHAWKAYPSGVDQGIDLTGVWVTSPTEAYAVGGFVTPAVIKWNGTTWSPFTANGLATDLSSVWGSAANAPWIGTGSGLAHYDGSQWVAVPAPLAGQPINQVWGLGGNDVWAVGGFSSHGDAFHYDGANWSSVDLGGIGSLRGVWSAGGAGNAWLVGDDGMILHR